MADDYAESFGRQWSRFRHTQLDSRNGTSISRDQFARVSGWRESDVRGQVVLDAGCGAGRYSEVALEMGAHLVSIDLSEAAYVTAGNLPPGADVLVVRGDVARPPLLPASFDKVFSIGVLQHTPDPLGTAQRLLQLVRPGGELAIWMYEARPSTVLSPKVVLRGVTRHLSAGSIERLSALLVSAFTPVARRVARIGNARVRRVLGFVLPIAQYRGILPLAEKDQIEWSLLDTHDWLSARYDAPQRFAALERALREAGASRVERRPVPGLSVIAIRGGG